MRKSAFLAVLCSILFVATMAFAGAPVPNTIVNSSLSGVSTVNTTWTGVGGGIQLNTSYLNPSSSVGAGATVNNFGGSYSGSAAFQSVGDNPYSYGVNTTRTTVQAGFSGSGSAELIFDRTSSYPMYGPAGQNVQGFVTSDDTGQMALSVNTNYAALGVANYGKPTTVNGRQFEATGSYTVMHSVTDGAGQGGVLVNQGTGTTQINAMSSDVGGGSFNFGAGQGSFTNAKVISTGSGVMQLTAGAQDQLRVDNIGLVIPGGGSGAGYLMQATYNGATVANPFSYQNWSISGQ